MNARVAVILMLAVGLGIGGFVYKRGKDRAVMNGNDPKTQNPADRKEWKPEEIVKDPQGYLAWSTRQVDAQIADREAKLRQLADRRKQFEDKRQMLQQNIAHIQNLRTRMQQAYQ